MSQHLKLHPLTGTSDHDLTGLVAGQLLYTQNSTNGVQSTGMYADGSGGLTATTISATTINAGTLQSGGTNLYSIFLTAGQLSGTSVSAGSNISVVPTGSDYKVSTVGSPSFNSITASGASSFTTLSATTLISGSTNLYSIFAPFGTVSGVNSVGGVGNITTGGTDVNPTIAITATPSFGSISSSGLSNFSAGLSASTLSGGTIYSGGTNLNGLFVNGVVAGSNTTVGGSSTFPTVNVVGSPSFNSITASGASSFTTLSATTIISGSTNLYSIFAPIGVITGVNSVGGVGNITTGGTAANPTIAITATPAFGSISSSGLSNFSAGLSASTLSGGTIYSGGTNLNGLFVNGVVAGSNTTIGGSSTFPTVNVVGSPSFNSITASGASSFTTLSATTLISGSTNLYSIFAPIGVITGVNSVGGVGNITTGGTAANPTIILASSPSFNSVTASGSSSFPILSATTIFSAGTDLGNMFVQGSGTNGTVPLWNGTRLLGNSMITQTGTGVTVNGSIYIYGNVDILGTASTFNTQTVQTSDNNITMNLSGSHVSALGGGITVLSGAANGTSSSWSIDSNGSWSSNTSIITSAITVNNGGAIISGSTNLYNIFAVAGSGVQSVGGVGNIATGGTATNPIISISSTPSFGSITSSGASSFTTLSATTMISGSTNLYSIFAVLGSGVQSVGGVGNVSTGGTATNPTISISANPSFGSITSSGASSFTTLSATTIISGSTNLYSIFAPIGVITGVNSVGGVGNITTGGTAANPTIAITSTPSFGSISSSGLSNFSAGLSASTLSGGTIYSGGTNLNGLFVNGVVAGSNTTIGGSSTFPTVSVVASPSFNSITASGASSFTTLSATTLISGSTNLYSIFAVTGSGVQSVGANGNLSTGGTATNPTVIFTQSPSVNNLTASGNTSLQATTGTTIYASQFFAITPYTGAAPAAPLDNQLWMYSSSTGIITLNYKIGGVIKGVELS